MSAKPGVAFHDFRISSSRDELSAVERVLNSGWLILGEEVRLFEEAWAAMCGLEYAVGVGNGLDAIEIGLRAAGIGPGDEVITTPMTAVATVLGILRAGATPVLADVDPEHALLDPASVDRCVNRATRAVLLVHLYGQMRDMAVWTDLCDRHRLTLVEDCAQAHDASCQGRMAGSVGQFGAYSFYPTKNLGAVGDAGALVTSDPELAQTALKLRNYGQSNRYEHPLRGLNSRLDEIQAAVLRARLPGLRDSTSRRRQIARAYEENVSSPWVQLPGLPQHSENHVYHLFVVRSPHRDALQAHLAASGIQSLIHYPIPVHQQRSLAGIRMDPQGLPIAERHARECLSLPCAPHLNDVEVSRVIDAINAFRP